MKTRFNYDFYRIVYGGYIVNWKEEYVLRYKEFKVNEEEVVGYIQEVLYNINRLFKENNMKEFVELIAGEYFYKIKMPDDIVNIEIHFFDDKTSVTFQKTVDLEFDFNRETKQVELSAGMGTYIVHYDVPGECCCEYLHLNYDLIDSIFEYLLT